MLTVAFRRFRGAAVGPMPEHLQPMLATLSSMPGEADRYAFEYKWDGVRALLYWDGRRLRLESRNLLDITAQYPELHGIAAQLGPARVVLDGEIVALDAQGRVSFSELQRRMHVMAPADVRRRMDRTPVFYMIFDLLYLDGQYLLALPYQERRDLLEQLSLDGPAWRMSPSCPGGGEAVLQAAQENHLEGVMAKRIDSPYTPGRRSDLWLKIKIVQRQEFVIGGWMPLAGDRTDMIGALLVGCYDHEPEARAAPGGRLIYAGSVGTGYSDSDRRRLAEALHRRFRPDSPFATPVPRRGAIFARPELVCEVEFREWTHLGTLRHPSFKGLRLDKPAGLVIKEIPKL